MIKISHLVVNGDSFTYCPGLKNREKEGWPYLLADRLGCKIVNLAIPGTGNDTIHRRLYEYILSAVAQGNKPLVIVAWSQFWRKETWFDSELDYKPIGYPRDGDYFYNEFQKSFIDNFNDEDHARRTYIYKASLISLFKHLNLPYLMSDYSSDSHLLDKICWRNESYYNKLENFMSFCHDKFHLSPLSDLTTDLPKTECMHDGIEGNLAVEQYLLQKLLELYGKVDIETEFPILTIDRFDEIFQNNSTKKDL